MKRLAVAAVVAGLAISAAADAADIKIALIHSKTGPFEAYAKQTETGLRLGLEYATGGSMANRTAARSCWSPRTISSSPISRSRCWPRPMATTRSISRSAPAARARPGAALAMLPVAEEYKKVLIVEPAVADQITGEKWNRYIFRTARNSSQDAISNAVALGKPGLQVATLAQDYAFGRDGVAAFKAALPKTGASLVFEEYAPQQTTDFTASAQRLFDGLKDKPGNKVIWVLWAGATLPMTKLLDLNPGRYGITIASGGNLLSVMAGWKPLAGMEGATYYYYEIPRTR